MFDKCRLCCGCTTNGFQTLKKGRGLFKTLFVQRIRRVRSPPRDFTLCTIFGRMPGIKPKLLQPQPGVLPMSYTHPKGRFVSVFSRHSLKFVIIGQSSSFENSVPVFKDLQSENVNMFLLKYFCSSALSKCLVKFYEQRHCFQMAMTI